MKLDANVAMGKEGEEVFSEAKSLLFKVGSALRPTGTAHVLPPSPPYYHRYPISPFTNNTNIAPLDHRPSCAPNARASK